MDWTQIFFVIRFSLLSTSLAASVAHDPRQIASRAMAELAAALLPIVDFVGVLRDESVAIRHFDFRQARGVHYVVFLDDLVAEKNERRQGIYFVRLERALLVAGHGSADVVEDRRRVRPVRSDRHFRVQRSERALAADERGRLCASFLAFAVA